MVRHGTKICQRPGSVRGESKEESQEFMKKLHTYIGHYWYGYLFAICSMIIATGLDMVYPQITQRIVDEVIIGGKMEMLRASGGNRCGWDRTLYLWILQRVFV